MGASSCVRSSVGASSCVRSSVGASSLGSVVWELHHVSGV